MLKLEGLTVKYENTSEEAVKNCDFSLMRSSITSLVGESGSGKSTIVNAILGLLPVSTKISGQIIFEDKNLAGISDDEFRKIRWEGIALVSQGAMNSFTPVLTIGHQIKEVLKEHLSMKTEEAEAKIAALLESVGLDVSIAERYPHELSGGQKQRAAIATALACNPKLLLADEPTTALDVITQKGILDLLCKLRDKTGITILLVTHDLPMAASISDSLLVMKDGVIVERGTANELLHAPKTEYTKKLLAAIELPTQRSERKISDKIAINAKNISVSFESKNGNLHKAVNSVSLILNEGDTLAIVGESGSGKTTLMRALMGLQKTDSGSVEMFDKARDLLVSEEKRELMRMCGYVPQDPYGALPPGLTALEAVMEPFIIADSKISKNEIKNKALKLLESVGLFGERIGNSRAVSLSGGQRQRVELARALALSPKLLLCDEPTSMQDVSTRTDLIELLEYQVSQGMAMIFVTHDLMLAACAARRIMVMKNGQLCEEGLSIDVLNNPQHEYTKALLDAVPKIN